MKKWLNALGVILVVGLLLWLFVIPFTGPSVTGIASGIVVIGILATLLIAKTGLYNVSPLVRTILLWGLIPFLIVIVWIGVGYQWDTFWAEHKAEAKIAKKALADPKLCRDEESEAEKEADRWVAIPDGFYKGKKGVCVEGVKPKPPAPPAPPPPPTAEELEWPRSGQGFATKAAPIKAWFDPRNLHTRPSRCAKYELVGHPTMTHTDCGNGRGDNKFATFPPGKYIITPVEGDEEMYFRWWQ